MNDPEPRPTDEQLAALMAAANRDAPPPDPAFLARLRDLSQAAFDTAQTPTVPAPPEPLRKRTMIPLTFRWLATGAAALVLLGAGIAFWVNATKVLPPDVLPPEEKFVAEPGLTDDGRIGKVTDAQGAVAVKPATHERWSPVQPRLVLKPGDWLRTDARGANAAALRLLKAANVIVGPHSTVELVKADEIRLIEGEIEIDAADAVELHGPDKEKLSVKGKKLFRVEKEKLVAVEKEPLWLQGFRGTTANESLGSLVAKVDGREVPLTVGYHHVNVEIRDQIARTTIEESFVNTTNGVLEGVFYFPLPQDASISGFGMWIGNELVEADVVERLRAQEIYEDIRRSRRDPGLLEWAGGNMFKARVFPIPGNSEKRIKITYTQVLPLQGSQYRYSYGLQSELLKQHPVRDIKIDVKASSAVSLKNASSPTHASRVAKTDHSAHIEWSAQEHVPTRDFEAVFEIAADRPDIVVLPHRRGGDGYFLVQLTPPAAGGAIADRAIVPDGEPLKLLLLADTSASMDKAQRAAQASVVTALLGALTPRDTVNLALCDVNCDWVFEKPQPATPTNLAAIHTALAARKSLGWTDLDKTFASALKQTDAGTHVVYLGDATVTTGNADPVAFAKRLQRLYEGKAGTFHAVAVGSTFESGVMKAIASLGGGSARRVSGDRGPQGTALDLLTEIASPGLRDVKVEFVGLRTARVYPETLPNVPAGTQQILLGRYLPEGKDQSGEIVVTGTSGGKPVRFTQKVSLKDAEQGNSFIPRLWARMHLDKLLEQGQSPEVKQDVIALSEEFHIITPYTSLLVLESDADRELYGVRRRFQMRDGERFFADGVASANFELKQKQMRLAADYRTTLRRSVLAQLQGLGRDPRLFSAAREGAGRFSRTFASYELPYGSIDDAERSKDSFARLGDRLDKFAAEDTWSVSEIGGRLDEFEDRQKAEPESGFAERITTAPLGETPISGKFLKDAKKLQNFAGEMWYEDDTDFAPRNKTREEWDYEGYGLLGRASGPGLARSGRGVNGYFLADPYGRPGYRTRLPWLGSLFPALPQPARDPGPPKSDWPAPAQALSKSLVRTEKLAQLKGGVVVARRSEAFDARGAVASRADRLEVVSPTAWLVRTAPAGGPVAVTWCDAKEFGSYSAAFQLGRTRAANAHDLRALPLELYDDSITPLHVAYAQTVPTIETPAKDRALVVMKYPYNADAEIRVLIDTARNVVLSYEYRDKGKVTSSAKYDDFVEVAGTWWAKRVERFGADGQRQSLATQTVTELPAEPFAKRMEAELAGRAKALLLRQPLPSVVQAKAAVAAGKATFDDRAALTLHFAATQQWDRAAEHLLECEKCAAGKPGMRWLRDSFLGAARRHEELRKRLLEEGAALAASDDADTRANDLYLAGYLADLGYPVLEPNERLALSDALKKVYDRHPDHLGAARSWRVRRASLLEDAGQTDKALQLAKELAAENPRDVQFQTGYVQALVRSGDYAAAYAWIDRALGPPAKWDRHEADQFRNLYAQFLQQQTRYRDLAGYLAAWMTASPESERPYDQYLPVLVYTNRAARAEELAAQWLRGAMVDRELSPVESAKFSAAREFALGQAQNLHANRADEKWQPLLAEVALYFARRDVHVYRVNSIVYSSRFAASDAGRAARKELAALLLGEAATMSTTRLDALVSAVWSHGGMERDDWNAVAAALRKRWDAEPKPEVKFWVGHTLARLLGWLDGDDYVPFLRDRLKTATDEHRAGFATELFNALLNRPWAPEVEDEAFGLLDKLADPADSERAVFVRVAALHRLTDAMLAARVAAQVKAIDRPDKLTRAELQQKHAEIRKSARAGLADRLRKEGAKHAGPFAAWLVAERVWLDVPLDRDLKAVADECWRRLAAPPAKPKADEDARALDAALDDVLRARFLTALENLAARKGADPALAERVLKYLDQQLKDHPDDPRWRTEKYHFLVALDRLKELEAELRGWVAADGANRWRLGLGYLLAEQGKVPEAIEQFEAVAAADELGPVAYRALADWYLVENRRAEHEGARVAAHKVSGEYQLAQRINQHLYPWQNNTGSLPSRLDPEVPTMFVALFAKAAGPENYLGQLQQFYQACRDFRLLAVLPDAVVGHSAGKVYPFLQGMQPVLNEVRDEATADELVKRIAEVRLAAKSPIDRRALDLLELMVERRASEVQNQPGPHADKALAALVRAFKGDWAAGEPRLMADLLAALGSVSQKAIAEEQLRQLEALHRGAAAGSFDRLHVAWRYAVTLNGYARRADAIGLLLAALKEFEEKSGGQLPTSANGAVVTLVSLFEGAGHYDRGEKFLLAQLGHPVHAEQREWLDRQLTELYLSALRNKGEVSLGAGPALYKALEKRLLADLPAADPARRYRLFASLANTYRAANGLRYAGVGDDVRAYASKTLPPLLAEQNSNYDSIVRDAADALEQVVGPREGLAFLLDRVENEPDWMRYTNHGGWSQNGYRIGEWRVRVKDLGDLEPRVLRFVLAEVRRDLRAREQRSRYVYDRRHSHYWAEKEAEFAAVAEEVLADRKDSGATAEYVAEYLFHGLAREKRAIEVLLAAHERKLLSENGQSQLVDYLHRTQRYAESIALLLPLVETRPTNLYYRRWLMYAYFRTEKRAELLALWRQTDKFFHEKDRWNEGVLSSLAESCLETHLFAQSAAYYEELIPLHQRAHERRGGPDGTLSHYYSSAARAYSGLGKTKQAVDMASGAIVSWGPNQDQRKYALGALVQVLEGAKDLDAYAAELDKEPLQSAIVRKALGQAYVRKDLHAKAVAQLQIASELQPNDTEIYTLLLACHDKTGDREGAVRELFRAVELSRRDVKLFEQLGNRLSALNQSAEAERAYTSIVEMLANESEGHALLAEVRERQKRWPEAISHWERVAELRALEPTGLVKLAGAQIEFEDWAGAAKTLKTLRSQGWPPRFNELPQQLRDLERKLAERPKK